MNKFLLLLPLGLVLGGAARAQARLGLKAGVDLATYVGPTVQATQAIAGPLGGFTLNLPVTSDGFFSVQPELIYAQRGSRQYGTLTTRQHYLDVPVLARVRAGGLVFEAGPQAGYLLYARSIADYPGTARSHRDITTAFNRFEASYVAGVGYQLGSGPHIGVRYHGGITRIYDRNGPVRNSVFQLFAGYVFGSKE